MKNPKILYILISVFCVFAIIAGIYAQFIDGDYTPTNTPQHGDDSSEKDQVQIGKEFEQLFTNTLIFENFDSTGIQKLNSDNDIVYTIYEKKEENENYEIDLHIPIVNIKSDLATKLNQFTQNNFVNKANDIMKNTDSTKKSKYSIDYIAYINGNILSVVIKTAFKEGDSAQRIIIKTYNYNLSTNEEPTLNELITLKKLNKNEVNNKIKEVVSQAHNEDLALQNMGITQIYMRDLSDPMYSVEGANTYFLGQDSKLYIIYAYGNSEFTSKMDIILFE